MFATGNIFRSTGTTSSEVKDEKFSSSMNLEKLKWQGGAYDLNNSASKGLSKVCLSMNKTTLPKKKSQAAVRRQ